MWVSGGKNGPEEGNALCKCPEADTCWAWSEASVAEALGAKGRTGEEVELKRYQGTKGFMGK